MGRFRIAFPFLIAYISYASMGFSFTCKQAERNALLKFKHSFTTDIANQLGSWVGQNCCSWKGVRCDNVTGNVIKLALNGGSGRYSSSYLEATEVNPALLQLKYLTYLDLSFINFNGCSFPEFIGSMRELRYLNLSSNTFQGKVPHNLGNLTKLVVLDIGNWHDVDLLGSWWSGKMEMNLEWVVKLENLQYLDLSGIDLSQALVIDSRLNLLHKLPSLLVLNLAHCTLENSKLFIGNSTVSSIPLQHLDLGSNLFSGPIPFFIQNLSSISYLDLSFNYLNSSIPAWLGNKKHLKFLSLGNNSFGGSFPLFIQNLSFLTNLDLSNNQFISSIPSWLVNKRHLEYLDLSGNSFDRVDGGIMNIIGRLCSLQHLDLSYNQLQEEVLESHVHSFPRCSRYDLKSLHMGNNNMSGQLPTIESLLSLQELDLSHNNFESIPTSFGELSSLESVDLSYNHLSIVTQASLANLSSLETLDMSSNSLILDLSPDWMPPFQLALLSILPCKFNSQFPKWLLSQKLISDLDLSDTGMFGPLPYNIGSEMPFLWSLRLANNHINGSIPRSLCRSIGSLDLQNNTLSGIIPDCWANSSIVDMELSSNKLSGPIPHSLTKAASLYLLSLNNNLLEGELPLSLSNCAQLTVLDVGRNNLHGEIPPWINGSNFPTLKVLILRENRFKGRIPLQLCSFPLLQVIDLGRNDLIGTIPQCFGYFKGMGFVQHSSALIASPPSPTQSDITSDQFAEGPTMVPDEWSAVEVIKGKEREYTTILHLLVNMDLSCNHLVGVIPAEITSLSLLFGLNLSHNHLNGTIPKEMGKMKSLESLDLSFNNLSGSIPQSISSLDTLSAMNLSFNNLHGQIPTGRHFQTLDDPSIYTGNPGLCGDPLPKCSGGDTAHPPTSTVLGDEEEDDKHEKMWFYSVIMSGFATGFWGVIGVLVFKKRWRLAYFQLAEEFVDWLYVKVKVRIARAN